MCSLSTQCLKTSLLTQTHSSFESPWIPIQCWGTQAAFGGPIIARGSLQEIRDRSILHGVFFLFPNLKKNLGRREIRFLLSLIICARIYNSSMIYLHSLKESKVVQIIMIQYCCNSLQVTQQTELGFYICVGIHIIGLYSFISQLVPSLWSMVNKTNKNSPTFIALFAFWCVGILGHFYTTNKHSQETDLWMIQPTKN